MSDCSCLAETKSRGAIVGTRQIRFTVQGHGPVLVLLPGTIDNELFFCRIQTMLQGVTQTYVIDHLAVRSFLHEVALLPQVFAAAGIEVGKGFFLGGTSLGGRVVQYYAAKYPEGLKGLILGNTFRDNAWLRQKNLAAYRLSIDDDPVIPPLVREELIAGYPEAATNRMARGGHFPNLTNPEPYGQALREFILPSRV